MQIYQILVFSANSATMSPIIMFGALIRFLNQRSQRISSAALIVAFFSLISRLFGLWRDRLLAGQFGASRTLDIYFAAFKVPDLVYNLLIVGAISSAFIPIFYERLTKDKNEAWQFAANVLNVLIFALIIFSAVLMIFAPQLINLVAPGFDSASKELAIKISRILFLSPLLLGISAFAAALLQAFSKFLITALAPIFYNLGIIFGIVYLTPRYGIWGLAHGVIIGALLHFLIQVPALAGTGFRLRALLNFKESGLIKMAKLWLPRTLSLLAFQINGVFLTAIASILATGSIAIFHFADNLRWVPIGIVGIAFSTAAFPAMSLSYAQGKKDLFLKRFSLAVKQAMFIVIPLSLFIFALRAQIIGIVLRTGNFSVQDARLTAAMLGIFAFGIFAAALFPIFTRAFFAFQNTRTPVIINVVSMVINIVLAVVFVWFFSKYTSVSGILGLPLSVVISSIINVIWHWIDLKKHVGDFGINGIKKSFLKILVAGAIAVAFIYLGLYIFSFIFNMTGVIGLLLATLGAGSLGVIVYLLVVFAFGMEEISMLNIPASLLNWRGIENPESEFGGHSLDDQY